MKNGMFKIEKEGYLKIHIAVDIKTKEILALKVIEEKLHDGKMLKKLVNHVLDYSNDKKKIKSILAADGAHDTNTNFRYLEEKMESTRNKGKKEFYYFP